MYGIYVGGIHIAIDVVVITCILGLKNSLTLKWSSLDSLTLEINFVLVWKALQGSAHVGSGRRRKKKRQSSSESAQHG